MPKVAKSSEMEWKDMHGMHGYGHGLHGGRMAHLGFKIFIVGALFWIGDIYAWKWFQTVTAIGLIFFFVGIWKKMAMMSHHDDWK